MILFNKLLDHRPTLYVTWALVDQIALSLGNLVFLVLTAYLLRPTQFGQYSLLFGIVILLAGFQNALVLQPLMVQGVNLSPTAQKTFFTSLLCVQLAGLASLGMMGLLAARLIPSLSDYVSAAAYTTTFFATVTWMVREFTRRLMYFHHRTKTSSIISMIFFVVPIAVLVSISVRHTPGANAAMLSLGLGGGIASLAGLLATKHDFQPIARLYGLREAWEFGSWLAASSVASWVATQIQLYVVAYELSAASVGALKLADLSFGPLYSLLSLADIILVLNFSRLLETSDAHALYVKARPYFLMATSVAAIYSLFSTALMIPVLQSKYSLPFSTGISILLLVSFRYVAFAAALVIAAALRALQHSRAMFTSSAICAVAILVSIAPLVRWFGLTGAAMSMALSTILLGVLYFRTLHQIARARNPSAPI